mmetsp:Transcript_7573/g.22359  ORF Transcript_7573/g.22359 Transcript_7573/m.22359 type:complete len:297 (-) Transcript_7573:2032-2922(-)
MASRSLRQSSVAIRAIGAVETQNAARHAARHAVRHASTGSLAGGRFGGGQLLVAPPARRGGGATGGGRRAAVLVAQLIVQLIQLLAGCVHALRIADQAPARVRHQTCRDANVDSGFLLVTSDHPDAHAALDQSLDRLRHTLLQLVLNGGDAQQLHLHLKLLSGGCDARLPVVQRGGGLLVLQVPRLPLPRLQHLGGNDQGAQALHREGVQVLLRVGQQLLVGAGPQPGQHHRVGALAQQPDGAIGGAGDNGHARTVGAELQLDQHVMRHPVPLEADGDLGAGAANELEAQLPRPLH